MVLSHTSQRKANVGSSSQGLDLCLCDMCGADATSSAGAAS